MERKYKLSVIIPTLNRLELFKNTYSIIKNQIDEFGDKVEFIIVDNNSNDGTGEWIKANVKETDNVKYFLFDKRVEIVESFKRCIDNSIGDYILIFGDDDYPFPGFIDNIYREIENAKDDVGVIYCNRLICNNKADEVMYFQHKEFSDTSVLMENGNFISKFLDGPGFISSIIFKREIWKKGIIHLDKPYHGYNFLGPIFYGNHLGKVLYIPYPQVIQRKGVLSWKKKWPLYWLVGFPSLLNDLDNDNITKDALNQWHTNILSFKSFFITILEAKAFGYKVSDPFWNKAAKLQTTPNKIILRTIQYLMPSFLPKFLFKMLNKKYK